VLRRDRNLEEEVSKPLSWAVLEQFNLESREQKREWAIESGMSNGRGCNAESTRDNGCYAT